MGKVLRGWESKNLPDPYKYGKMSIGRAISIHHSDALSRIKWEDRPFFSNYDQKFEKYYERLLPVFEGTYTCPICTTLYNVKKELETPEDLVKFRSLGEEYAKWLNTPQQKAQHDIFANQVYINYGINLETYYEILKSAGSRADINLCYHRMTPPEYFGLLVLHCQAYATTANIATSKNAITAVYKKWHELRPKEGDMLHYVQRNYKETKTAKIINALNRGEEIVADIMRARGLNRWDALTYCIDFNMVGDLFILSCDEFRLHGEKLIKLRERLRKFADDNTTPSSVELKEHIKKIQKMYYIHGKRELSDYEQPYVDKLLRKTNGFQKT